MIGSIRIRGAAGLGGLLPLLVLLLGAACSPASSSAPAATPPAAATSATGAAAQPTSQAAASSADAGFDERAVADFYRGKTIRVVIGFGAGGVVDVYSRTIAQHMGAHIPGTPNVIVENRGGAGSLTAANAVYKSEAKDGTVIGAFTLGLVLQQAVGGPNLEFDAPKFQWLGAAFSDNSTCLARTSEVQGIKDLIGTGGKELATGSLGSGTATYQTPAAMNAVLGTHFKLVPGYGTLAEARLAFDRGEIDAYCPLFSAVVALDHERLEGANPPARMVAINGDRIPDHPLVKGVPRVIGDLAQTEDQKSLLRAISSQDAFFPPYAMAPEVPHERVLAMRRAFAQTLADPALRADADKANLLLDPRPPEELDQAVKDMLNLPAATLDKLRPLVV